MSDGFTSKIGSHQLVTLLAVSRVVALLDRPGGFLVTARAGDTVIGLFIAAAAVLAICHVPLPSTWGGGWAGRAAKTLLAAYLLVASADALLSLAVFIQCESEVIFPAVPIVLLMMLVVFYAMSRGIEGIARFALMAAVIFTAVLGFTVAANHVRMDITNLAFPLSEGTAGIAGVIAGGTVLCPEIAAYIALGRFVRREKPKRSSFTAFYLVQAAVIAAFTAAQELVFGSMAGVQEYPIYSLAIVGEFSIFQRLDVIHLAVWCIVSVVKLCSLTAAAAALLADAFPTLRHSLCNLLTCTAAAAGAVLMLGTLASDPGVTEYIMAGLAALALAAAAAPALLSGTGAAKKGGTIR
jgi:hypothetical protein